MKFKNYTVIYLIFNKYKKTLITIPQNKHIVAIMVIGYFPLSIKGIYPKNNKLDAIIFVILFSTIVEISIDKKKTIAAIAELFFLVNSLIILSTNITKFV